MLKLTLSASLFSLLPYTEQKTDAKINRTVTVDANSWEELVHRMRIDYPQLADHVLTPNGLIKTGFLVAVNDDVAPRSERPDISGGDGVMLFTQMAGG
ncbi:MoaD/ThiS family protein [Salinispora pacifica]|uniref:MoaD/ThiS family protein n=1 Tax=Salinispora pacifica TaxID=351187 RepID=UPI0003735D2E|nr:MoaD/ThiS family protein [Salinispora pacifica]